MTNLKHILTNIPTGIHQEIIETLTQSDNVRIERIISRGQASPEGFWYDQTQNEFVMVVQGGARLEFAGGDDVAMGAGDYLIIPAHARHRVAWTDPDQDTVWLAVFY